MLLKEPGYKGHYLSFEIGLLHGCRSAMERERERGGEREREREREGERVRERRKTQSEHITLYREQ